MGFLLLGIDSLIVGAAICMVVSPRARLPLAALFGIADGALFLIGAGLGWRLGGGVSEVLQTGILVGVGLYLLVIIAAGTSRVAARWPLWVLPWALTLDNLTFGLVGDLSGGSLVQQAGQQALSSSLLALVGLLAALMLPRVLPAMKQSATATRFAGGALVLAAGGLVLLG
ncbi:MAG: hypothetical protein H0U79_01070 [Solirubrobacterales bacterium]|nr:hypothetical protein [Solirubrobacterales bacterium]